MVNLNRTDLATDEDKAYGIDNWVKIFKAKTWEELRMLAENNEYVEEMVRSLFKFNSDEQIREQCEDIEIEIAARKARYRDQEEVTARLKATIAEKDNILAENEKALAEKDNILAENEKALAEKDNILAENEKALAVKDEALIKKDAEIAALKALLVEHNIKS